MPFNTCILDYWTARIREEWSRLKRPAKDSKMLKKRNCQSRIQLFGKNRVSIRERIKVFYFFFSTVPPPLYLLDRKQRLQGRRKADTFISQWKGRNCESYFWTVKFFTTQISIANNICLEYGVQVSLQTFGTIHNERYLVCPYCTSTFFHSCGKNHEASCKKTE